MIAVHTCKLVEVEANGQRRSYGPFTKTTGQSIRQPEPMQGTYSKKPHEISLEQKHRLLERSPDVKAARDSGHANAKNAAKIAVKEKGLYYLDAAVIADVLGRKLIRLQCYEGLDESKALYEWNYKKQLLRIQADDSSAWSELEDDIFSEDFLLTRPLLEAIRAPDPVVLLIDEIDRVEVETEALMLEVLSDFQVSIPELGTVVAATQPLVILTSNNTRELSEALKRRCLFLHIGYPSVEREKQILKTRVEGLTDHLADQVARLVRSVRNIQIKKPPSVSESIDWARTLLALGIDEIGPETVDETLHVLLKYQNDIDKVSRDLSAAFTDSADV